MRLFVQRLADELYARMDDNSGEAFHHLGEGDEDLDLDLDLGHVTNIPMAPSVFDFNVNVTSPRTVGRGKHLATPAWMTINNN